MKRLFLFFILSAAFPCGLFASDSLPFPVSLGGQAAKDGTPFAKIENPVVADAELAVESKSDLITVNVNLVNAKNEPVPGSTPAVILLQGKTKTKETFCRKLRHECGQRRQDCQHRFHHQVALIHAKRFIFATHPNLTAVNSVRELYPFA
jgi:hypothetical protein